jgi:RHS repeat-associated protein
VSFLVTNGQRSAASSIDATTGAVTNRYFLPFGGTRAAPSQATTWPAVPHGFLNSPLDAFTGLTHLGARDYNPALGQFTTPDPVLDPGDPQQANPYAHAGGNPVATADQSGLCPKDKCGAESPSGGSNIAADFPSSSGGGGDASNAAPGGVSGFQATYNTVQANMQAQVGAYAAKAYMAGPSNPPAMSAQLQQWVDYHSKCGGDIGYCYASFEVAAGMQVSDADAEATAKAICLGTGDLATYCHARYLDMSGVVAPDPVGQFLQDTVFTLGIDGLEKGLASAVATRGAESVADGVSLSLGYKEGWSAAQLEPQIRRSLL